MGNFICELGEGDLGSDDEDDEDDDDDERCAGPGRWLLIDGRDVGYIQCDRKGPDEGQREERGQWRAKILEWAEEMGKGLVGSSQA